MLQVIVGTWLTVLKSKSNLCAEKPEPAPGKKFPEPPQNRTAPKPWFEVVKKSEWNKEEGGESHMWPYCNIPDCYRI